MASMISAVTSFRVAAMMLSCVAVAGISGCGRTIGGTAVTVSESRLDAVLAGKPLSGLLLDRSRWPSDYSPRTLNPGDAQQALAMVDGMPPGGRVTPSECQPPVPTEVAVVEGSRGDETALRLVLARGVGPLSARRDQLARCTSYSATSDTAGMWTVSVQLLPPPVVDADDTFAFDQTQKGSWIFNGLVLVGQVGDVRVTAQATGSGGEQLDTTALDAIFTTQVQTLRHAG
jgi:hypothetical protein